MENNVSQQLLDLIPHEYIVIGYDANGKKNPREIGKGYTHEQAEVLLQSGEYVAVNFALNKSEYAVIDFDCEIDLEDILNKYEICDSYVVRGNTKGHHVYIKIPDKNKLPDKWSKNITDCMKEYTGDYLGAQVWEKCDKHFQKEFNCMELQGREMIESFEKIYKIEEFDVKKQSATATESNTDTTHLEKIGELIKTDPYLDDRMTWMQIVTACKASGLSEAFARKISQKSDRYTDAGFDGLWFQYGREGCTATAGTLHYYAKKSNPDEYNKIKSNILLGKNKFRQFFKTRTDHSYAEIIIDLLGDDLVFTDDNQLYIFDGRFWKQDDTLIKNMIQKKIINLCNDRYETLWSSKDADKEHHIKETGLVISSISSVSKLNSILEQLKISLCIYKKNIAFDTLKPNVFCWNNQAFDINTGERYEVKKTDYISIKNGHDYTPSTQDQRDVIHEIFTNIFPDEEMRKTYLSILRTGLTGYRQEKLFMASGLGRNGKGLINELMASTCGDYAHKLHISVLTKEIKSGPNPEVANLHLKRWVVGNEANDNEQILAGNMKRLTGDDVIDARALYSNDGKTKLCLTLALELNKLISLMGRIDDAIIERLVNIKFETRFTTDENVLATNPNARRGNPYYKTDEFKTEYRCALFDYILQYGSKELYVCERAKADTLEYLRDNDEMLQWFLEKYEKVEEPTIYDYVQVKDVYALYQESNLYLQMTKSNKRKSNLKHFKRVSIQENCELSKSYVELYQKYEDGKRVIGARSVMLGWRLKPSECVLEYESGEE